MEEKDLTTEDTKSTEEEVAGKVSRFRAPCAVINSFFELCEEILKHYPERGPVDQAPATWPAEWPIWRLMTEVGCFIHGKSGDAHLYATATGDIELWSFEDLGAQVPLKVGEQRSLRGKAFESLRAELEALKEENLELLRMVLKQQEAAREYMENAKEILCSALAGAAEG